MPENPNVDVDELSYLEAITEVEAIVASLESQSIDVDELSAKVSRGLALVAHCRTRLDAVTDEVDRLVGDDDEAS